MAAPDPKPDGNPPDAKPEDEFLSAHQRTEPKVWLPWIVSCAVVVLVLLALTLLGRHSNPVQEGGGTGMAATAPYAANLPISGVQMSEADTFSGAKVTYIDGQIANTGNQTITAITVQVGFRNDLGQFAQRLASPLTLIRTRQPYVDTEPVSAAPLKPGDRRDFRLIFDTLPPDWNQQLPEIRIIHTQSR